MHDILPVRIHVMNLLDFLPFLLPFMLWISAKAGADDKPLRIVKIVLHELVKLRGTAIKGHLSMVPVDIKPQPIILAYIDPNLQVLWLLDYN